MREQRDTVGVAHGAVAPRRIDPTGERGPTKSQAAGRHWRRTGKGLYVPAAVVLTPEQRIAEVGAGLPARGAAVTGWAALRWRGGSWFGGLDAGGDPVPVPVAQRARLTRPRPGLRLCEERRDPGSTEQVDGVPTTAAVQALAWAVRYAPTLAEAVVAADMALFDDLLSPHELAEWVWSHPSWTGIAQARTVLGLLEENSWSPQETRMRLAWVDAVPGAGLVANRPVFDLHGRHLGTPDLLDPAAGVCAEYAGDVHLTRERRSEDLRRIDRLRAAGLRVVDAVAGDLGPRGPLGARLRSAYADAVGAPASARAWTLEPPPSWCLTHTVARRLALTPGERAVFLRYRRPVDLRRTG
ncbi:hypothetical protein [Nocardioides sp. GY 10127]|uniref:hypothetical protein n=1 Tax=Nocardioides sp. GY 10127 TaxID=2569762 RepID=UPI0010A9241F|nr:hypothetical protein [Nocardioides sp. GY 10127]TIC79424.1 hypothetical protein E8D37_17785 [Nocardioides sp. GY 10127]